MKKKRGARLGQHFLTGTWAAKQLTAAIAVRPREKILEVGPGKGALTKELLATGAPVVAIEKDGALITVLNETFKEEVAAGQLTLVGEDIRNFDSAQSHLSPYVVAANIPYYITGEIIRQFLTARVQPRAMALLIQKEVAERIIARDSKESILSVSVKAYGTPKMVAKVRKGNFSPPPSVDSAILLVDNISRHFFNDIGENLFFKIVRAGFSSKRKLLAGNLSNIFEKEKVALAFLEVKLPAKIRAEDVSLEQWKKITELLG